MIAAAYMNPTAFGDLNGSNYWVWYFSHLLADTKFMGIFSILFGAGIVLFSERLEAKNKSSLGLHYKRNIGLWLIGMIHAYIIWSGDILVSYAICSFVLYWFRNKSVKNLFLLGLNTLVFGAVLYMFIGNSLLHIPEDVYFEFVKGWQPDYDAITKEVGIFQGGRLQQMAYSANAAFALQTFIFLIYTAWRSGGLMLIGMSLYKSGFLSAQKSNLVYGLTAVLGLLIGIPIVMYGIDQQFGHGWTMEFSMFQGTMFNYFGSLGIIAAYIALVQLFVKNNILVGIQNIFAACGRMALTNYIGQSVIGTFIFYGFGLGYFGKVSRTNQLFIVLGIWLFQLIFSYFWMKKFRFGPLEWLWRSFTYNKWMALKK